MGALERKSGRLNVVIPLPPYVVPSRANKAELSLMDKVWPLATNPPATVPALSQMLPKVQEKATPENALLVSVPNKDWVPAGP